MLTGEPERVVGHALYDRAGPDAAEVAFAVDGAWQGRGLATTLLAHLASAAAEDGIAVFEALTLAGNHRMIGVFRASGFPVEVRSQPGELHVRFPTSLTPEGRRRFEARERDAAVAAVAPCCARVRARRGRRRRGRRRGARQPGARRLRRRGARRWSCRRSRGAPGAEVDLAGARAAGRRRAGGARACAARGDVRALAVLLGGGEPRRRGALVAVCREGGMRLVGPDSLGVLNTDPDVRLDATFAPGPAARGRASRSRRRAGVRDRGARPRRPARRRHRVVRLDGREGRPVRQRPAPVLGERPRHRRGAPPPRVVRQPAPVRGGRPARGGVQAADRGQERPRAARAPAADTSQTGALLAAADTHVDALFRHAGVIRTDTLAEMFDLAALLERQPVPRGDRVAIVTNAGGLGVQCADACAAAGLAWRRSGSRQRALAASCRPARRRQPGRRLRRRRRGGLRARSQRVLADPGVDAVIVLFARSPGIEAADVAAVARRARRGRSQPPLAVFMGADAPLAPRPPAASALRRAGGGGARAAARARRTAAGLRARPTTARLLRVDADQAAAIVAAGLARGRLARTDAGRGAALLLRPPHGAEPRRDQRAGPCAPPRGSAARWRSRRSRPGLLRKAEAGAVRIGVAGRTAVERAAREVLAAAREHGFGPTACSCSGWPAGIELLAGIVGDPSFGPLVGSPPAARRRSCSATSRRGSPRSARARRTG